MVVQQLTDYLLQHTLKVATAESCTAGMVASALTQSAGSSDWFECGFVTYSNRAKQDMLDVSQESLHQYGAVSEQVASEMVYGACNNSHADVALSITGIAGPSGGTQDKPVGTVCFGFINPTGNIYTTTEYFAGDRAKVRQLAVDFALKHLLEFLQRQ